MISTKEFAELNGVQPATVLHRYCLRGSYFGITPEKMINGRLRWPNKTIHKITSQQENK